jgi:hypothetical protein
LHQIHAIHGTVENNSTSFGGGFRHVVPRLLEAKNVKMNGISRDSGLSALLTPPTRGALFFNFVIAFPPEPCIFGFKSTKWKAPGAPRSILFDDPHKLK